MNNLRQDAPKFSGTECQGTRPELLYLACSIIALCAIFVLLTFVLLLSYSSGGHGDSTADENGRGHHKNGHHQECHHYNRIIIESFRETKYWLGGKAEERPETFSYVVISNLHSLKLYHKN